VDRVVVTRVIYIQSYYSEKYVYEPVNMAIVRLGAGKSLQMVRGGLWATGMAGGGGGPQAGGRGRKKVGVWVWGSSIPARIFLEFRKSLGE
jgi:hypothetical protein